MSPFSPVGFQINIKTVLREVGSKRVSIFAAGRSLRKTNKKQKVKQKFFLRKHLCFEIPLRPVHIFNEINSTAQIIYNFLYVCVCIYTYECVMYKILSSTTF